MAPGQRRVLIVAVLASFVPFLDGAVINVALPAIAEDFAGGVLHGLALQQWVVDAYLISLGSFILVAGSLSDVLGRRRVMFWGLLGFLGTSLLCAAAPTGVVLVGARGLQGIAGALLVPSSLAMIISAFHGEAQSRAIGVWTAWTGTAMIAGPVLGGLLVDLLSWRWVFVINILPIAVTLWLLRSVDEGSRELGRRVDVGGAVLAALGLAGPVFALIEKDRFGVSSPVVWLPFALGLICLGLFLSRQYREPDPMLPLSLFRVRNFAVGNVATVMVYGALSFGGFAVVLFIQQVAGYTAAQAGFALVPVTFLMIGLAARFGTAAGRYGPRAFMTVGPIIAGAGYLLMLTVTEEARYLTQLLPGLILFGLGLAVTVAPLTSAILGGIREQDAGIGSAVNNAIARIAGLVVIAFAGIIIGPHLDLSGFHRAVTVTAVLLFLGGLVSWVGIRNPAELAQTPEADSTQAEAASGT